MNNLILSSISTNNLSCLSSSENWKDLSSSDIFEILKEALFLIFSFESSTSISE